MTIILSVLIYFCPFPHDQYIVCPYILFVLFLMINILSVLRYLLSYLLCKLYCLSLDIWLLFVSLESFNISWINYTSYSAIMNGFWLLRWYLQPLLIFISQIIISAQTSFRFRKKWIRNTKTGYFNMLYNRAICT